MTETTVLVTGGAGNLGRAVTRAFLAAGARVAVPFYKTDRPDALDELKRDFGAERLLSFALDLTTERGAGAAVHEVTEWAGGVNVVAHLVGGYRGGRKLADTAPEEWDRMLDLNLKSAFLITRAALPEMVKGGGGAFVFVSSQAARHGRDGHAAYAVAKAGLLTLAEAIAEEYRERGIRANAVLPNVVDTEDNRRAMPNASPDGWTAPEDIARIILFLASGQAGVINGAAVPVYG